MNVTECVWCGKQAETQENTWDELPGWGCLYGILAVCSRPCAEEYAKGSVYGQLREEDVDWSRPLHDAAHAVLYNLRQPCPHGQPQRALCDECVLATVKWAFEGMVPTGEESPPAQANVPA